jgi:hypothetical protein
MCSSHEDAEVAFAARFKRGIKYTDFFFFFFFFLVELGVNVADKVSTLIPLSAYAGLRSFLHLLGKCITHAYGGRQCRTPVTRIPTKTLGFDAQFSGRYSSFWRVPLHVAVTLPQLRAFLLNLFSFVCMQSILSVTVRNHMLTSLLSVRLFVYAFHLFSFSLNLLRLSTCSHDYSDTSVIVTQPDSINSYPG